MEEDDFREVEFGCYGLFLCLSERGGEGGGDGDYGDGIAGIAGAGEGVEGCEGEVHFGLLLGWIEWERW